MCVCVCVCVYSRETIDKAYYISIVYYIRYICRFILYIYIVDKEKQKKGFSILSTSRKNKYTVYFRFSFFSLKKILFAYF